MPAALPGNPRSGVCVHVCTCVRVHVCACVRVYMSYTERVVRQDLPDMVTSEQRPGSDHGGLGMKGLLAKAPRPDCPVLMPG